MIALNIEAEWCIYASVSWTTIGSNDGMWPVASFANKVNPRFAKRPLKTNERLANLELTSLVKEAAGRRQAINRANADLLSMGHLGATFSNIKINNQLFHLRKFI